MCEWGESGTYLSSLMEEILSILEDMESSMDQNVSILSPGKTPSQELAYRIGYYAAIRDARRLL